VGSVAMGRRLHDSPSTSASSTTGAMRTIVLVGMRGCGKSTLGVRLAAALGREFVDLDAEVERTAGRSIPEIFAAEGEGWFRRLEARLLAQALERSGPVVAPGGGAILLRRNRERMARGPWVIYVHLGAAALVERLRGSEARRPRLTALPLEREVPLLLQERDALYREVARHVVEVGAADTVEATHRTILQRWEDDLKLEGLPDRGGPEPGAFS